MNFPNHSHMELCGERFKYRRQEEQGSRELTRFEVRPSESNVRRSGSLSVGLNECNKTLVRGWQTFSHNPRAQNWAKLPLSVNSIETVEAISDQHHRLNLDRTCVTKHEGTLQSARRILSAQFLREKRRHMQLIQNFEQLSNVRTRYHQTELYTYIQAKLGHY
jgi:hypothetical protein